MYLGTGTEDFALHTRALNPPEGLRMQQPEVPEAATDGKKQPKKRKAPPVDDQPLPGTEDGQMPLLSDIVKEMEQLETVFDVEDYASKSGRELDEMKATMTANSRRIARLKRVLERECLLWFQPNVVVSTLQNLHDNRLSHLNFDTLLIDEAGQPLEVIIYQALTRLAPTTAAIVATGDRHQIAPMTVTSGPAKFLLSMSLPERMERWHIIANPRMTLCYRMHPLLTEFVSKAKYDGTLVAAVTAEQRTITAKFPLAHRDIPITLISTPSTAYKAGHSWMNPDEAEVIVSLYDCYTKHNGKPDRNKMRIICPYEGQKVHITAKIAAAGLELDNDIITTVDAAQGTEADICILSLVRSDSASRYLQPPLEISEVRRILGFVSDERRGNVACSRAKHALFVVADAFTIRLCDYFFKLVSTAASYHVICSNFVDVLPTSDDVSQW